MTRQTRRGYLRDAALGGAGLVILTNSRSARAYAANDKLNVALIGVGGRGKWYADVIPKHAHVVATCDVNESRAQAAFKEHAEVRKFHDFREMLDKIDKEIDAVTVATPDHTHAMASVTAMKRGKHVLCEKGLTRTIEEARLMRKVAMEKKLATQMGNQGSSCNSARRGMEVIQDGIIGDVKEVYSWSADEGPDWQETPKGEQPVPPYLNWDLWLGYAPFRPFHSRWLAWNSWREFGAGRIGMWSSHGSFIAWNGLNMRSLWEADPQEKVRIQVEAQVSGINNLSFPKWAAVHYRVPRGKQPACDWYWIGGLNAPGMRQKIEERLGRKLTWDEKNWQDHHHSIIVGTEGTVHAISSNFGFAFVPADKFQGINAGQPQRYSRVPGEYSGHESDWLRACRDGQYTVSDFRNTGPYTEFLLLSNVASQISGSIEYDPIAGKITNNEQANALLTCAAERLGVVEKKENAMRMHKTLLTVAMMMAATAALAAEAAKAAAPDLAGADAAQIRDALVKKRNIFRPTEQDLKKLEAIAPDKPAAAPAKPRKLLCWGRLWTHLCNPFTDAAVQLLGRKTKAFEVVASDDPQLLLPESLKNFDAVFLNGLHDPTPFLPLNWKTLPPEELAAAKKLDAAVKQSILDFVAKDGKGIAGIEGSICALRDWKEFGELMGAFYNGHYVGDFVIKVEDPAHPLTAGLSGQPFRVFDQAYVPGPPYSRKNLRVLLSLDMKQTADPLADPKMAWLKGAVERLEASTGRKNDYPISWVRAHGRGRVFYVSLGVQKAPYSNPLFLQYLLAGIQFATGDLPADTTPSEK